MDGHRHEHDEQKRVPRFLQAEVDDLLSDRQQPGHGTRTEPVRRGVTISTKATSDLKDQDAKTDDETSATSLPGRNLQVVVVHFRESIREPGWLVDPVGGFVRVDAGTDEREVGDDPGRVPPRRHPPTHVVP